VRYSLNRIEENDQYILLIQIDVQSVLDTMMSHSV